MSEADDAGDAWDSDRWQIPDDDTGKRILRAALLAPHADFGGAPRYPGPEVSDLEAEALPRALRYRLHGSVVSWSGERWHNDDGPELPNALVPGDGRWFALRSRGLAAKRWRRSGDAWALGADYDLDGRPLLEHVDVAEGVRGLAELFELVAPDPHRCIIRGIPARAPSCNGTVRRAKEASKGAWLAPHPVGRRGVIVDVDAAPAPAWAPTDRPPTPAEALALVRHVADAHLPRSWAGASVAYRWTSSAGVRGWRALSLHLGLWLERPVYDVPLRRWVASWGKPADPKVIEAVQPIYCAAPIFEGGPDPLAELSIPRTGFLPGARDEVPVLAACVVRDELVPLVDGAAWHAHEAEAAARAAEARRVAEIVGAARAVRGDPADLDVRVRAYAAGALRRACEAVAGAAQGVAGEGRHDTLLREASGVGGYVAAGLLAHEHAAESLLEAFVSVAGRSRRAEGRRTIKDGFDNPRTVTRDELVARLRGAA